jgi:ATP-dependent RNA helicase RhlE
MLFADLRLADPILRAVTTENYTTATPIQAQAIPPVLEGKDVMGCAQTGTGKTAAFALPLLHRLSTTPPPAGPKRVRCLVLCPTRELATQIAESFRTYGKFLPLRCAVVFGGVGQWPQVEAIKKGVEVLIATPGRLIDLMNQNLADLRGVETLVLDEADRMLDMGFIPDIRRIVQVLPVKRQTLMFSATMPSDIRRLAESILKNPVSISVAPVASTAAGIDESVYFVQRSNKPALLAHLVDNLPMTRAIVFTRTKHGADRLVRHLHIRGIRAEAIHGNKTQNARQRALQNFRSEKTPVLVATDIASRGIDIDGITHVVNYDLTHEPETYVHRIGRTARAGATGMAIALCDPEELPNLRAIERLIRRPIPVKTDHPVYAAPTPKQFAHTDERPPRRPHAPAHHADRHQQTTHAPAQHRRATTHTGPAPAHRSAPSHHAATQHAPSHTPRHPAAKLAAPPSGPRRQHRKGQPGRGVR